MLDAEIHSAPIAIKRTSCPQSEQNVLLTLKLFLTLAGSEQTKVYEKDCLEQ